MSQPHSLTSHTDSSSGPQADSQLEAERQSLEGRLTKMRVALKRAPEQDSPLGEAHEVDYTLSLFSDEAQREGGTLEVDRSVSLASLIGRELEVTYLKRIQCVNCDRKIRKTYGDGLCFPCFDTSASSAECVIRPELCLAHEGKGRDPEWERRNHAQPHLVYLALTSHYKVGVTRDWPTRWIDQGAAAVKVIAETPYRQLAGQIEVALSAHYRDKTVWQRMLKGELLADADLASEGETAVQRLSTELQQYHSLDQPALRFIYPLLEPIKRVKSVKLDKLDKLTDEARGSADTLTYRGQLMGARGQYLIFRGGVVLNLRAHTGYHVRFTWG